MRTLMILTAAAATVVTGSQAPAQVTIRTAPGAFAYVTGDPDRAMIGVSTRSSGKRDTLGLLVESVTRGGPAEDAGIEEGDRLVSVNGVNLRLSPLDAGEADMAGVANRRLVRELEKLDAGAEVSLQVYRDGSIRTVRLRTVSAEDLNDSVFSRLGVGTAFRNMADRAALGISLGGTGSPRDTLGVLVVGVTDSGPAALAGLEEGDRIASINGVELRVAREDAGDRGASNARINRLNREMGKVKPGDVVELRVWSGGQYRSLRAEAVRANELRGDNSVFFFDNFNGVLQGAPGGSLRLRNRITTPNVELFAAPRLQLESRRRGAETLLRSRHRMEDAVRSLREAFERNRVVLRG